jgi:dipeptidyl aminopeptidase/acylaminoacyl peptidase
MKGVSYPVSGGLAFTSISLGFLRLAPVVLALACHGEATAPPPPAARFMIVAGDQQNANVCARVAVAPAVRADSAGTALAGVRVIFTVVGGGGTVTGDTAVTDAAGVATVASWTLGPDPGANKLVAASSVTSTLLTFTATGRPEPVLHNVIIYTTEAPGLPAVAVVRPDGSCRRLITTDGLAYASPAISPDGRRIAVARYVTGWDGIWLLNVDGTGLTQLVKRSSLDGDPAWSPDGSTIAFESQDSTQYGPVDRIFLVQADGTGLRQLTFDTTPNHYSFDAGPSWSSDGTRIVFSRTGVLYVINADGTGLTDLAQGGEYPSWSPDGVHIVSGTLSAGWWLLTTVNADGTNPVTVTQDTLQLGMPRWSPDGASLVFYEVQGTAPNYVTQLFTIHRDGSGKKKLSAAAVNEGWPNWSRLP